MKRKDIIFLVLLVCFEGLAYYAGHIRNMIPETVYMAALLLGVAAFVLWVLLRIEARILLNKGSCRSCGSWVRQGKKYCGKCGAPASFSNIVSMFLDLIFLRKVRKDQPAVGPENLKLITVLPDGREEYEYRQYQKCSVCGLKNNESTPYCPSCGGNLRLFENREMTIPEKSAALDEAIAKGPDVGTLMELRFIDIMFKTKISEEFYASYEGIIEAMEKYGDQAEAKRIKAKINKKLKQVVRWDVIWALIKMAIKLAIVGGGYLIFRGVGHIAQDFGHF